MPELAAVDFAAEDAEVYRRVQEPVSVLSKKRVCKGGELATGGPIEKPDQPEIMEADPPLGSNEQVSSMRQPPLRSWTITVSPARSSMTFGMWTVGQSAKAVAKRLMLRASCRKSISFRRLLQISSMMRSGW